MKIYDNRKPSEAIVGKIVTTERNVYPMLSYIILDTGYTIYLDSEDMEEIKCLWNGSDAQIGN